MKKLLLPLILFSLTPPLFGSPTNIEEYQKFWREKLQKGNATLLSLLASYWRGNCYETVCQPIMIEQLQAGAKVTPEDVLQAARNIGRRYAYGTQSPDKIIAPLMAACSNPPSIKKLQWAAQQEQQATHPHNSRWWTWQIRHMVKKYAQDGLNFRNTQLNALRDVLPKNIKDPISLIAEYNVGGQTYENPTEFHWVVPTTMSFSRCWEYGGLKRMLSQIPVRIVHDLAWSRFKDEEHELNEPEPQQ